MVTGAGPEQSAPGRVRPVWRLLSSALAALRQGDRPVRVLDCGGGTGTMAVPLAGQGADVTVLDISVDALATLNRRASDAGVAHRVRAVQGEVENLPADIATGSFDLALAHGLLESVQDSDAALRAIAAAIRPGGMLSIVVANPDAAVLGRALAGDLVGALAELTASIERPARFGPRSALAACADTGLRIEAVSGLGVFTELVAGHQADAATDVLERLEELAAARSPYREIAGRVHVLAQRLP